MIWKVIGIICALSFMLTAANIMNILCTKRRQNIIGIIVVIVAIAVAVIAVVVHNEFSCKRVW